MLNDNTEEDVQYIENTKTNETLNEDSNKTPPKSENIYNVSDKTQNGKYNWVGDLVVSQLEDIDIEHRGDFVWDIQCLVRKYLMKSKISRDSAESSKSNETEETKRKDITFHKGSNIAVNVNFL